jgi:aspartyl-tRNA(Asn)/glutamyl-tRNA(Gln) amidotransferase subunit B
LPKAYQISQYDKPICYDGYLDIGETKINIQRIHQEEDVAKMIHMNEYSLVDYNKSGLPLLEMVTYPEIRTADEAYDFARKVRSTIRRIGISDADMEKGQMRCEPNISVQEKGSWEYKDGEILPISNEKKLNPKVEIKNLASISAIRKAIQYEFKRQTNELENGGEILQETRGWDPVNEVTVHQRTKEEAADYRYFPEPDIPPIIIKKGWIKKIQQSMPAKAEDRRSFYEDECGIKSKTVDSLMEDPAFEQRFEELIEGLDKEAVSTAAGLATGPWKEVINDSETGYEESGVEVNKFQKIVNAAHENKITSNIAKELIQRLHTNNELKIDELINQKQQISDKDELEQVVQKIIEENPQPVEDIKNGKKQAIGVLIGQVMKETKGKANPEIVTELINKIITNE